MDKENTHTHRLITCLLFVLQTLIMEGKEDPRAVSLGPSGGNTFGYFCLEVGGLCWLSSSLGASEDCRHYLEDCRHYLARGCPVQVRQLSAWRWPAYSGEVTACYLLLLRVRVRSPPWPSLPQGWGAQQDGIPSHSHDTGLDVLTHALVVVVVIIRPTGRGVERRNAVEVEDEIFPVAHRGGVMLVARQSH